LSGQAHKPGDIPFPQALPGPANGVVVTGPTLRPAVSPGTRSPSSLQQRTDSYDITGRRDRRTLGSGGPVYTWGYDAKDRITSYGDPAGSGGG
jgi:hypothetical protein